MQLPIEDDAKMNIPTLTNEQRNLLMMLAPKSGVIYVRGEEAEAALSLSDTKLVALGPTESSGAVMVLITAEGRAAISTNPPA